MKGRILPLNILHDSQNDFEPGHQASGPSQVRDWCFALGQANDQGDS